MNMRVRSILVSLGVLVPFAVSGQTYLRRVPVVTQVQGAVFYRTSVTISNDNTSRIAPITLLLSYRSPVDGTFQTKGISAGNLAPRHAIFYDDIIQTFKDAGVLQAADANAALFGSLIVKYTGMPSDEDVTVVARTYSPATGGGTNGIAYPGRETDESGSTKIWVALRDGTFGPDGTTRANIGIINGGVINVDAQITYYDADTGALLKAFKISDVVHHPLSPEEVVQINNVFGDSSVPATTTKLIVEAIPLTSGVNLTGYAVQLDSVTNDGSFFDWVEYD